MQPLSFSGAIWRDGLPGQQLPGSYRLARNAEAGVLAGTLVHERGTAVLTSLPGDVCGQLSLGDGRVVYWLDDAGTGEIGILADSVWQTIVRDPVLNLSQSHPVRQAVWDQNPAGELLVAWTDGRNPPSLLNLDRPALDLTSTGSLVTPAQWRTVSLFPPAQLPLAQVTLTGGGSLEAGSYSLVLAYEDRDRNPTPWLPPLTPVLVTPRSTDYRQRGGSLPGSPTTNELHWELSGLDTSYPTLLAAVVVRQDGVLTAYQFRRVPVPTTGTLRLTLSGGETRAILLPEEVLTPPLPVETVQALTSLRGKLYVGNVTLREDVDVQPYVNSAKLHYVTEQVSIATSEQSLRSGVFTFKFRPYLHGEVYAFYLAFRLKNGQRTGAYHLPGRPAGVITVPGVASPISETTLLQAPAAAPRFTVYQVQTLRDDLGIRPPRATITRTNVRLVTGTYPDPASTYRTVYQQTDGSWRTGGGSRTYTSVFVPPPDDVDADVYYTLSVQVSPNQLASAPVTGMPAYLSEDAGLDTDVRYFQTRDTSSNPLAVTNMGYWENSDEFYPDTPSWDVRDSTEQVVGSLRNQPVRHHRFPCLSTHGNLQLGESAPAGLVNILGVEVTNLYLPADFREQVQAVELLYAKRQGDTLVLGQSLEVMTSHPLTEGENELNSGFTDQVSSSGGNWHFYDNDNDVSDLNAKLRGDWVRLHPPDALATGAQPLPAYLRREYRLGRTAKVRHNGDATVNHSVLVETNFLDGSETTAVYDSPPAQHVRRVSESVWVGAEESIGKLRNRGVEDSLLIKLATGDSGVYDAIDSAGGQSTPFLVDYDLNTGPDDSQLDGGLFYNGNPWASDDDQDIQYGGSWTTYWLSTLYAYRQNVYVDFSSQELASAGYLLLDSAAPAPPATLYRYFGGDGYVGDYGVRTTAPNRNTGGFDTVEDSIQPASDAKFGVKHLLYYPVESTVGVQLRHQDTQPYYPLIAATGNYLTDWLDLPLYTRLPIELSRDVAHPNDLQPGYPTDPTKSVPRSPTLVLASAPQLTDGAPGSWKRFPVNDQYTHWRTRGELETLWVLEDTLLLHFEQSLFRTQPVLRQQVDGSIIVLGTGELFSVPPQELLDGSNGYLSGTLWSSGCVTKLGYAFCTPQGKVFVVGQGVKELSAEGMRRDFQQLLRAPLDNLPALGNGTRIAWDEVGNRLLLVIRRESKPVPGEEENDLTMSYLPDRNGWVSVHDYAPEALVQSGSRLVGIKNRTAYQHRLGDPGSYYGQVFSFRVELVLPAPDGTGFRSVRWRTTGSRQETDVTPGSRSFQRAWARTSRHSTGWVDLVERGSVRTLADGTHWNGLRDSLLVPGSAPTDGALLREEPSVLTHGTLVWHQQRRLDGSYLSLTLDYQPVTTNRDFQLALHNVDVELRSPNR